MLDAAASRTPWRSRGYLPHCDLPHALQAVTFRLADALPRAVVERMRRALAELPDDERNATYRRRVDELMDAGYGSRALARDDLAALVEDTLLRFDGERYRMLAWVVMPNHVHALIEMAGTHPLARVVQSWKSYTGRRIIASRAMPGASAAWQREYWDRYMRDAAHALSTIRYIERNPVKAGQVREATDWRWSSAWRRLLR